eukprot:763703-Rhodomonas_salina.1
MTSSSTSLSLSSELPSIIPVGRAIAAAYSSWQACTVSTVIAGRVPRARVPGYPGYLHWQFVTAFKFKLPRFLQCQCMLC